jgi:hypothetical protein
MKKIKQDRQRILSIITIFFVIILILSFGLTKIDNSIEDIKEDLVKLGDKTQNQLISKTVLEQSKRTAKALRQGFRYFFQTHPNLDIRRTDGQGRVIYRNLKGEKLSFNQQVMELKARHDFFYDIYNKEGKLLLKRARPIWNREVIKQALETSSIMGMKLYGPTGDPIILDPYTGELLLDNSKDCATVPEVVKFAADGTFLFRDINLDYKHPNAGYPEAVKWIVDNKMTWRRDGIQIYYFGVKDQAIPLEDVKNNQSMNFNKYPLGNYNREFQYQFVVPSETLGLQGTDMQLVIILGAQEAEITSPYQEVRELYHQIQKGVTNLERLAIWLPRAITVISMLIATLATFGLRNLYLYVLQKE